MFAFLGRLALSRRSRLAAPSADLIAQYGVVAMHSKKALPLTIQFCDRLCQSNLRVVCAAL
jgi:hypothetical protein